MNIAIVGGGYTGLTAALRLRQKGHGVTVYEASNYLGGVASGFEVGGSDLEKFYHHLFASDSYAIKIINELGLESDLHWYKSKMGYFTEGKVFPFGTPRSLIGFTPLNFYDKFRFGLSILKLKELKNWREFENVTAHEWLIKNCGYRAYHIIWEPLLRSKFGEMYREISMSWFWGKVTLRASNQKNAISGEKLGYLSGSFGKLTRKLSDELKEMGTKFFLGAAVKKVICTDSNRIVVESENNTETFDKILITTSNELAIKFLPQMPSKVKKDLNKINYTATICMVLEMNCQFSDMYWMNIGDVNIPFGGLIEHTNLVPKELYGGRHILYISNYIYHNDELYSMGNEQLLNEYIPYLVNVNPRFKRSNIENYHVFRARYAQPIITTNYKIPSYETGLKNIYLANMTHIYPEDRGINYAIRTGEDVANYISS